MRPLLLALLLLWLPAAARAQPPSALQQMGVWAQQLSTAQQPIVDAYHQCSPVMQQIETALQAHAREELQEFATGNAYRNCLESMRRAAETTRDNLNRMGPMPLEMERDLHLDSRDILRRSAASVDGFVGYNDKIREALDAFAAGNEELVQRRLRESRALVGSVIDGQILLLETMRAALPLQAHKSMMDVRLVIMRSLRILSVADPATDSGEASAGLRAEGARARIVAQALRANWSRETVAMRRTVARLRDSRRAALIAAVDGAVDEIAAAGDRIAISLQALPSGRLEAARAMGIMRELAETELLVLERARRIAVAAGQFD
jgi:hypothetical protein